jgi:hypothetical protein
VKEYQPRRRRKVRQYVAAAVTIATLAGCGGRYGPGVSFVTTDISGTCPTGTRPDITLYSPLKPTYTTEINILCINGRRQESPSGVETTQSSQDTKKYVDPDNPTCTTETQQTVNDKKFKLKITMLSNGPFSEEQHETGKAITVYQHNTYGISACAYIIQ